jgi:hypothetical protein
MAGQPIGELVDEILDKLEDVNPTVGEIDELMVELCSRIAREVPQAKEVRDGTSGAVVDVYMRLIAWLRILKEGGA